MLILKRVFSGVASGVLIGIGGTVYLLCENKIVGAVMFSVALLCICYKGFSLFTGKVGYLARARTKKELSVLFCGLLGNFIGAVCTGFAVMLSFGAQIASAPGAAAAKLAQAPYETFLRAFMCGILMYMAVSIFKNKKSPLGIIFCIPTFILCGFEHSIADMYYLTAGLAWTGKYIGKALLFCLLAVAGNAAGAVFIALFDKTGEQSDEKK